MKRRTGLLLSVLIVVLAVASGPASAVPGRDTPVGPDRSLTVMTRNVYLGADLGPVIDAATDPDATPTEVLLAAAGAYAEAIASDFPFRGEALAQEIARTRPALVGIQEATIWRTGPLFDPAPASDVDVDLVAMILEELHRLGLHYQVVERIDGFDAELPLPVLGIGEDVRLTVGDVLLRDAALPASDLRITAVTSGLYATQVPPLPLPPPLAPAPFPRQWIAADVVVRGVAARVITTHLEALNGFVRTAQAGELLTGPADGPLPTLIIGDLNSEVGATVAPGVPDSTQRLVGAGFADLGPPGDTCCQDSDLRNAASGLDQRIDLILGRGGFTTLDAVVTGADPIGPSPLGVRYASDHAGVTASVVVPRE